MTVIPALVAATVLPAVLPWGGAQAGVVVASLLGALTYLLVQRVLRSPELKVLSEALETPEGCQRCLILGPPRPVPHGPHPCLAPCWSR